MGSTNNRGGQLEDLYVEASVLTTPIVMNGGAYSKFLRKFFEKLEYILTHSVTRTV